MCLEQRNPLIRMTRISEDERDNNSSLYRGRTYVSNVYGSGRDDVNGIPQKIQHDMLLRNTETGKFQPGKEYRSITCGDHRLVDSRR